MTVKLSAAAIIHNPPRIGAEWRSAGGAAPPNPAGTTHR
jgi:hypothetical protein